MRVIAKKELKKYAKKHADAAKELQAWYLTVNVVKWKKPNDVKQTYPKVSIVNDERLVFDIKGNFYRLIVGVNYETEILYIRWFGTHSDYDNVDASTI